MSYASALKHPKWFKKREDVLSRRGRKCELCSSTDVLHVHHKTYWMDPKTNRFYAPWEYPLSNFTVLCDKCHEEAHRHYKPEVVKKHRSKLKSSIDSMKDKFSKFFSDGAKDVSVTKELSAYKSDTSSLSENLGSLFSVDEIENPYDYGHEFSEIHEGSEPIYFMCLKKVKSIAEQKSIHSQNEHQHELTSEMSKLESSINELSNSINESEKQIRDKKEAIEKANNDLKENEAQSFKAPNDKFYIRLYGFIGFILIAFMFVFYSSAMFNAFFVDVDRFLIEDRSFGTIINLDAIPYLLEQGPIQAIIGIITILTAFAIPVAFAVSIHRLFEDGKKFVMSIIIFLTLIFDALLAYLIEQNKYTGQYLRGLVEEQFTIASAIVDIQFYLILMVGFGTFLLLSAIFHFYSTEKAKFDPQKQFETDKKAFYKQKKVSIETLNTEIKSHEQDVIRFEGKKTDLESKYNALNEKIKETAVNKDFVQNFVLEFTIGYAAYINTNFTKKKSKDKAQKLYEMVNEFFEKEQLPVLRTNVLMES